MVSERWQLLIGMWKVVGAATAWRSMGMDVHTVSIMAGLHWRICMLEVADAHSWTRLF